MKHTDNLAGEPKAHLYAFYLFMVVKYFTNVEVKTRNHRDFGRWCVAAFELRGTCDGVKVRLQLCFNEYCAGTIYISYNLFEPFGFRSINFKGSLYRVMPFKAYHGECQLLYFVKWFKSHFTSVITMAKWPDTAGAALPWFPV
jgi:hypothetical protein